MTMSLDIMFKPCCQRELDFIAASGFKRLPRPFPDQKYFYPVTGEVYAFELNKWFVSEFGKGYVTRFAVKSSFAERYSVETVGGPQRREWRIPARDIEELNDNIVGLIEIVGEEP